MVLRSGKSARWRPGQNSWNDILSKVKSLDRDADRGRYLGSRIALANSEQKALKLGVCVNLSGRQSIQVARIRVLASAR